MKSSLSKIIFTFVFIIQIFAQFNHTLPPLVLNNSKKMLQIETISPLQSFHIEYNFPQFVTGVVYESTEALSSENLHNPAKYTQSTSCLLYPIKMQIQKQFVVDKNTQMRESVIIDNQLYIVSYSKKYQFQQQNKTKDSQIQLYIRENNQLKLKQVILKAADYHLRDNAKDEIFLAKINNILYITDGASIYCYDQKTKVLFKVKLLNQSSLNTDLQLSTGSILKFEQIQFTPQRTLIHLVMTTKIIILKFITKDTCELFATLFPLSGKSFFDASYSNKSYYTLQQQTLKVFPLSGSFTSNSSFKLQSKICVRMVVSSFVIYLVCQESGLSYVAELYHLNEQIYLNKYWNDIEDAKNLFVINNNNVLITGEQDIILAQIGVHRQALIDIHGPQSLTTFRSFGIEKIEIMQIQEGVTTLIGVGVDFLTMFSLHQTLPLLECTFQKKSQKHSLLVVINSTSKSNVPIIDSILCPYIYYQSILLVTQRESIIITIVQILLFFTLFFLLLAFYCKDKAFAKTAILNIKNKIQQFKNKKKQLKPL